VVSEISRGMGVLDGGGCRERGRGTFGGEVGAHHCNQWVFATRLFSNYFEDFEDSVAFNDL